MKKNLHSYENRKVLILLSKFNYCRVKGLQLPGMCPVKLVAKI